MNKDLIDCMLNCSEKFTTELDLVDSIVSITKNACLEREFSGQYYGTGNEYSRKISAERNHYINMLTILSEKISTLSKLNISIEEELLSHQNANDSCRKVTTQGPTYKSS